MTAARGHGNLFLRWSRCSTRSSGRSGTCGSRSPTAATSAAPTACRRRSSGTTTASSTASELLSFEEITRIARVAVGLGVQKLRLTGGEPLLRRDLERLIAMLAELDAELTLTTNASLLPRKAQRAQGRRPRPDHRQPRRDGRRDLPGDERRRLPGRARARGDRGRARGRGCPVKVNCVVKRGVNEDQIVPLARYFRETRRHAALHRVHGRRRDQRLAHGRRRPRRRDRRAARRRVPARAGRGPATAARSRGASATATASGEIGVIASVTEPFCGDCTRARLSAEGKLYTCLFARARPRPARAAPRRRERRGARRPARRRSGACAATATRSSARRRPSSASPKVEMSYIGG